MIRLSGLGSRRRPQAKFQQTLLPPVNFTRSVGEICSWVRCVNCLNSIIYMLESIWHRRCILRYGRYVAARSILPP